MGSTRNRRISEEIKKVVSALLLRGLKDPRISKFTTVTDVKTTKDLRFTYIFISVYDPKANRAETVEALNRAKGFIRNELGRSIDLRYTPEPIFKEDNSIENALHIQSLLNGVKTSENTEEDETEEYDYEVEQEEE